MKKVIYTAIQKYLVYANQIIGEYVENQGCVANTPWQYSYAMGGNVDYENLKDSLNTLAIKSDEVWVFSTESGMIPQVSVINGLGLTNGVIREINLAMENGVPVRYFEINPESLDIFPVSPNNRPSEMGSVRQ